MSAKDCLGCVLLEDEEARLRAHHVAVIHEIDNAVMNATSRGAMYEAVRDICIRELFPDAVKP